MFAPWIPDVLRRVEDLARRHRPPASIAVTRARREVVNQPDDRPAPDVSVWDTADGPGILIQWPNGSISVGPDGSVVEGYAG